jgi:hypothetical protein
MSERLVLESKEVKNPIREIELDEGLAHARKSTSEIRFKSGKRKGQIKTRAYRGEELDRALLRILGNTALKRWKENRRVLLPVLAAYVVRSAIPHYPDIGPSGGNRYEGYKRAVMKMMSIRGHWQQARDRELEDQGLPTPERPKQTEHPVEEEGKHKGQIRLFS